ncbi:N,N-dimethylformamidase beta subunit family domain-containing protein [Rossellomorea sp. NRS-1567]|uniref:N,N-dimethylformamidase beta subunit family domain-containing protein n=1 Tax=Rossellomorea sp. NRS-1567 TaxID=3233901 RepID=UPI003D29D8A5
MREIKIVLLLLLVFAFASEVTANENEVERLGGKDRFEVAVNVSKKGWTEAQTVYIVNFLAFADALSATPLAYQSDAPILLTHANSLTGVTKDELNRLQASKVVLIGGTGSISHNIVEDLQDMGIRDIHRIGGKDRYDVSANVANYVHSTEQAVIATGMTFADALSIAPYAARNGYPILLTRKSDIPAPIAHYINDKTITSTIIMGGEGSVGKEVASKLPKPERIGGSDRYAVAANLIKEKNLPSEKAYIATGLSFADALTGSVLAAKENTPILLTRSDVLPDDTKNIIEEKNISNYLILGGPASVREEVLNPYSDALIIDNQHPIEGYGAKPSYSPGETIELKVHTLQPTFSIEVKRFGEKESIVFEDAEIKGTKQNYRKYAYKSGADWTTSYSLKVPTDWKSGMYGARIYDDSGKEFYIMFTIRNSSNPKPKLAVLANTFTWEAYNRWGGGSFYGYKIEDGTGRTNAQILNFQRPNPQINPYEDSIHLPYAEKFLLSWLEKNGYAYDVISEYDLHHHPEILQEYETLALNSHSEYWTTGMYDEFEAFLKKGGNVLNLSANSIYWKVAVKENQIEVRKDKGFHTLTKEKGGLWRDLARPESKYLGVAYNHLGYGTYTPYKVEKPNHWIFKNTGLKTGALIGESGINGRGAAGGETDKITPYTPKNFVRLAKGLNPILGGSDMIYYDTPNGGGVFSVGSLTFTGTLETDKDISQMVKNVLNHFNK